MEPEQKLEQLNQFPDFNNYLIFVLTSLKSEGMCTPPETMQMVESVLPFAMKRKIHTCISRFAFSLPFFFKTSPPAR